MLIDTILFFFLTDILYLGALSANRMDRLSPLALRLSYM